MTTALDLPQELITCFKSGQVVLFLGTACSRSAGLPNWETLLQGMQKDFELKNLLSKQDKGNLKGWFKNVDHYARIAELLRQRSEERYRDYLRRLFEPTKPPLPLPDYLTRLKSLPINRIVTTNFDRILESILGEGWASCTWQDRTEIRTHLKDSRPTIFHLYGRIDHFNSLIHTHSEYVALDGSEGEVARNFIKHLLTHYGIVILGYRSDDPFLTWLKQQFPETATHATQRYLVLPNPTAEDQQRADDLSINLLAYAVDEKKPADRSYPIGLAQWLEALTTQLENAPFPYFTEVNQTFLDTLPAVELITKQHYYQGAPVQWALVQAGATAQRVVTDEILVQLTQEKVRALLLTGAGAEGKSTILMQLAIALSQQHGYRVFHTPEPQGDASQILRGVRGSVAILIDQADLLHKYALNTLLEFAEHRTAPTCIILAARTHEWRRAQTGNKKTKQLLRHIAIGNRLIPSEAQALATCLLASQTVVDVSETVLVERLLDESNRFLLAAVLTAIHGKPLAPLLADIIAQVATETTGQTLLTALGYVVTLEAHKNKHGQPYFCSTRLFKTALSIEEDEIADFCARFPHEIALKPRGYYRIETRHPFIAKLLLPILFEGETPYLQTLDIHKALVRAASCLSREHDKLSERNFMTILPLIHQKKHEYEAARTLYRIASETDPTDAPTWQAWAVLEEELDHIGQMDQPYTARWLFKQGTEANPKDLPTWQAWALLEKKQGNIGHTNQPYTARWLFKQSIEANAKQATGWQAWALLEKEQGNIGEINKPYTARWLFKQGTEANAKDATIWQMWALLEKAIGHIGEMNKPYTARWLFKRSIEANSKDALAWQAWALLEQEQHNIGKLNQPYTARWLFKQSTAANPKQVSTWQAWALLEQEQAHIGEVNQPYTARWLFKQGVAAGPKHTSIWYAWALMEQAQGDKARLAAVIEQAAECVHHEGELGQIRALLQSLTDESASI